MVQNIFADIHSSLPTTGQKKAEENPTSGVQMN
jgi:hypothetical protein